MTIPRQVSLTEMPSEPSGPITTVMGHPVAFCYVSDGNRVVDVANNFPPTTHSGTLTQRVEPVGICTDFPGSASDYIELEALDEFSDGLREFTCVVGYVLDATGTNHLFSLNDDYFRLSLINRLPRVFWFGDGGGVTITGTAPFLVTLGDYNVMGCGVGLNGGCLSSNGRTVGTDANDLNATVAVNQFARIGMEAAPGASNWLNGAIQFVLGIDAYLPEDQLNVLTHDPIPWMYP